MAESQNWRSKSNPKRQRGRALQSILIWPSKSYEAFALADASGYLGLRLGCLKTLLRYPEVPQSSAIPPAMHGQHRAGGETTAKT